MNINVHDIVYLDSSEAIQSHDDVPSWVFTENTAKNIAVVRRMKTMEHVVPIGFRGRNRTERFAAFALKDNVCKVITPKEAAHGVAPSSHKQTIDHLRSIFKDTCWGIGGSVGFTMATGIQACRESSDVDIVLYLEKAASLEPLQLLHEEIQTLAHQIDVQVEIPTLGSCLLNELVTSPSVLVRTGTGVFLMKRNQIVRDSSN